MDIWEWNFSEINLKMVEDYDMSIIRNLQTDENGWFEEGTFTSNSIFPGEMNILIFVDDGATVEYAEKCIGNYNELIDKAELCTELQKKLANFFIYMYDEWGSMGIYDEIVERLNPIMEGYNSGKNLIDYLENPTLCIYAPQESGFGYGIECDCPWEPEHKCLIIIRNNELLYVGPSDGLDAWCDKDEYYCIWDNNDEI